MHAAFDIMQHFGILNEVDDIVSAHRTTIQINVAGAGGAAHLPGMVAAMTPTSCDECWFVGGPYFDHQSM
jgi:phosphoribosylcarboxyaminoimidazole (NCAIR) mutase